jgi:hypothetical protein
LTENACITPFNHERFRIFVRPQSVTDYFLVTMDPADPFKICLYPSVNNNTDEQQNPLNYEPDEFNDLILHNYLIFKRNIMRD